MFRMITCADTGFTIVITDAKKNVRSKTEKTNVE